MNEKVFEPFPVFETGRLILREVVNEDSKGVFEFNSDIETLKYIARDPFKSIDQAIEKVDLFMKMQKEKKALWWTFTLKTTKETIGYGGIFDIDKENNRAEIGYGLLKPFWGKGYVTEAVNVMVKFGSEKLQIHKLYGYVDPNNGASIRVLEKFGFEREAILKDHFYGRGQYFDMGFHSLITEN